MLQILRAALAAGVCCALTTSASAAPPVKTAVPTVSAAAEREMTDRADTLETVYRLAQKNDALLKSQAATAEANRETGNIYKAALLPQIGAGYSNANSDMRLKGDRCSLARMGRGRTCDDVTSTVNKGNVTLTQQLFNAEVWYDYEKGQKIASQADAQYRANELDLIVRVTDAYINVLQAIDTYQTALANEEAIARQLEQTQQRFNVGLIAITDVQESKASYDSARVDTLKSQGQIGIAFEAVQVLTGQPLLSIAPLSDKLPVRMPNPANAPKKWEDVALENNPDLAASALATEAARANALARRSAHLPTVSGSLQYNDDDQTTRFHPGSTFEGEKGGVAVVSVSLPLYSGGGISASRRQAYQQQMAAEDTLNNNRRSIVQQARSLELAVKTDIERVSAGQQAIVSAQSALDATQAGYEVGTRNIVDVLTAQKLLFQAKLAYYNARYQYIRDALRLQQTAGTLTEDNLLKLNAWVLQEKGLKRVSYGI